MKTNNPKDRRQYIRIPLLSEAAMVSIGRDLFKVKMTDVCQGGCFVEFEDLANVKIGEIVVVNIQLPSDLGLIILEGRIVWTRWRKKAKSQEARGFGVCFHLPSGPQLKIWESWLVYIRNKQIITVSKRIIEEFFGSKVPLL